MPRIKPHIIDRMAEKLRVHALRSRFPISRLRAIFISTIEGTFLLVPYKTRQERDAFPDVDVSELALGEKLRASTAPLRKPNGSIDTETQHGPIGRRLREYKMPLWEVEDGKTLGTAYSCVFV